MRAPARMLREAVLGLFLVLGDTAMSDTRLITDFAQGADGWRVVTDQVMGGVSDGGARLGNEDGIAFLELTGRVSTANNGGFVQARYDLPTPLPEDMTALEITVRGNGERYFIHLKLNGATRPWHYYQAVFDTGVDWQDMHLPLEGFQPSRDDLPKRFQAEQVASIALVAYGRDHDARVSLARISAR